MAPGYLTALRAAQKRLERFFGNYGGVLDSFTHKAGAGDHLPGGLYEGDIPVERTGYYTQILADETSQYIRTHVQQDAAQPFFLSLHCTAPHWPWLGPEDEAVSHTLRDLFHYDGSNLLTYARMVRALDSAVGPVLDTLEAQGLADHTLVISDGDDILPVLSGLRAPYVRTLYWRYKAQAQRAVRDGDWKYLKINDNEFLFNLADDVRERANLRCRYPEVCQRLQQQWEVWNRDHLPITEAVFTHGITPDIQADRYVPERVQRTAPQPAWKD